MDGDGFCTQWEVFFSPAGPLLVFTPTIFVHFSHFQPQRNKKKNKTREMATPTEDIPSVPSASNPPPVSTISTPARVVCLQEQQQEEGAEEGGVSDSPAVQVQQHVIKRVKTQPSRPQLNSDGDDDNNISSSDATEEHHMHQQQQQQQQQSQSLDVHDRHGQHGQHGRNRATSSTSSTSRTNRRSAAPVPSIPDEDLRRFPLEQFESYLRLIWQTITPAVSCTIHTLRMSVPLLCL